MQTYLIEVFMEHQPHKQLPEEDLCRRKDRLEVIAVTLTQGPLPWYDRAVVKADFAGYLQRTYNEVCSCLTVRVFWRHCRLEAHAGRMRHPCALPAKHGFMA